MDPDETAAELSAAAQTGLFPEHATIPRGFLSIGIYLNAEGEAAWNYKVVGVTAVEAVGYLQTLATMMAIDASGTDDDGEW